MCVCAHVCVHSKAKISFLGEILGGFGSGETCCVEGETHSASAEHYWNWCSWPPLSTLMPGTQAEPQPPKRYPEPSTPILACPRSFLGSSLLPSLAQNLAIWRVNGSTENGLMRNMNVPTLGPTCQPLGTPVAALVSVEMLLNPSQGWEFRDLIFYHLLKANCGQGSVILCPCYRRENWDSAVKLFKATWVLSGNVVSIKASLTSRMESVIHLKLTTEKVQLEERDTFTHSFTHSLCTYLWFAMWNSPADDQSPELQK